MTKTTNFCESARWALAQETPDFAADRAHVAVYQAALAWRAYQDGHPLAEGDPRPLVAAAEAYVEAVRHWIDGATIRLNAA